MRGNKAFTLAEVLITLVIIGVIGALTVPALIQNTQKQEYVSALKKAYSTLSQAAQQIITEEGTPKCDAGGWGCSNSDVFEKFRKYLNSAKECPIGKSVCFYKPRSSLGTNRNDWTWGGTGIYSKLILADGMQLAVNYVSSSCEFNNFWNNGSNDVCADISVDINGEKGPNIIGRDVFSFVLKENGLYPGGCDTGKCPDKTQRGYDCACKVLTEGAMNY